MCEKIYTDIIVLGAGVAGLTAAYYADLKKIAILYDGAGSSPYIHGFCLPVRENDSEELFLQDTVKSGNLQDDYLAKKLVSGSKEIPEFLTKLGIELDRTSTGELSTLRPLGSSVGRVVSSTNHTGAILRKKLKEKLLERGNITFYPGTRAIRLLSGQNGIEGVFAYDRKKEKMILFCAPIVILACGGFCGMFPFSTNSSDLDGNGIAMAHAAGARLRDLEFIQYEPCVAVEPLPVRGKGMITTLFYEGACLRNSNNERFLDNTPEKECVNKDKLSEEIYREIKNGGGTKEGGVWFDATQVNPDWMENIYPEYVKRYQSIGIDLKKEMVQVAPAPHTSLGGVEIDSECKTSVDGLLACGEVTGGVHGANRLGGNAGLETMVFGKIAGKTASKISRENQGICESDFILRALPFEQIQHLRKDLRKELQKSLGVIRNMGELKESIHKIALIKQNLMNISHEGTERDTFETLRLENDLIAADLIMEAAFARKKTCGCHIVGD